MKPKLCPTCNHPLPETSIASSLPPVKRAIFEAVQGAGQLGINRFGIIDKVYGHQRRGGPENADVIKVHVVGINKRIARHGLKITANEREKPMGNGLYRLIQIEAPVE